ncbi:MAG: hypothetical protein IIW34_07915 [Clostridia bacterium]|nr:hypothetical protein [Clostridia bacterium]MBQ5814058.1 hypothetical protein [Clostridia bacterium]
MTVFSIYAAPNTRQASPATLFTEEGLPTKQTERAIKNIFIKPVQKRLGYSYNNIKRENERGEPCAGLPYDDRQR